MLGAHRKSLGLSEASGPLKRPEVIDPPRDAQRVKPQSLKDFWDLNPQTVWGIPICSISEYGPILKTRKKQVWAEVGGAYLASTL